MASALVALAELKEHLQIPAADTSEDARLTTLIQEASDAVETYTRRRFSLVNRDEVKDGGQEVIVLDVRPLVSLASVIDRDADPAVAESAPAVDASSAAAILYRTDRAKWGKGSRRWRVQYVGGFAAAPADVKLAVKMYAALRRVDASGAFLSETLGDYQYSKGADVTGGAGLPKDVRALLNRYREVTI